VNIPTSPDAQNATAIAITIATATRITVATTGLIPNLPLLMPKNELNRKINFTVKKTKK
jgi:hypothetical protein